MINEQCDNLFNQVKFLAKPNIFEKSNKDKSELNISYYALKSLNENLKSVKSLRSIIKMNFE